MLNIFILFILLLIVCCSLFYRKQISILWRKRIKSGITIKKILQLDFKRKIVVIEINATEYTILCSNVCDILLDKKNIQDNQNEESGLQN